MQIDDDTFAVAAHCFALMAIVALVLIASCGLSHAAVECRSTSGSGYWQWREIDGRKCWYEGKQRLEKSQLRWPTPRKSKRDHFDPNPYGDPIWNHNP